nr:MAG TPA: hypothetical protein [Caudoviricetes sp.]
MVCGRKPYLGVSRSSIRYCTALEKTGREQ